MTIQAEGMDGTPTTELILAERDRLMRLARRLARCDADAEDLVQDTLLRAYRARDRFELGTSMRAWTMTILRRVFLTNVIRARRRKLATDTDAGGPLSRAVGKDAAVQSPAEVDMPNLSERLDGPVKRALERVPAIYRVPFWMSVVEDLTCAEIARRLNIPEGTAMSRIHRARERLKRDLVY
jgi:RNA polymerase sigma-70 factor (ECF subfamily)